jgi:hypothetical protein
MVLVHPEIPKPFIRTVAYHTDYQGIELGSASVHFRGVVEEVSTIGPRGRREICINGRGKVISPFFSNEGDITLQVRSFRGPFAYPSSIVNTGLVR